MDSQFERFPQAVPVPYGQYPSIPVASGNVEAEKTLQTLAKDFKPKVEPDKILNKIGQIKQRAREIVGFSVLVFAAGGTPLVICTLIFIATANPVGGAIVGLIVAGLITLCLLSFALKKIGERQDRVYFNQVYDAFGISEEQRKAFQKECELHSACYDIDPGINEREKLKLFAQRVTKAENPDASELLESMRKEWKSNFEKEYVLKPGRSLSWQKAYIAQHPELKNDQDFWLSAIRNHPELFEFIRDEANEEFIIKCIYINSKVFNFIRDDFKNNEEFVLDCIYTNKDVFKLIDRERKTDKEFVIKAVKVNAKIFDTLSMELQLDIDVRRAAGIST